MSNFGTQVRNNPLPLAIVGAGLAWLAFGSGPNTSPRRPIQPMRTTPVDRWGLADNGGGAVSGSTAHSSPRSPATSTFSSQRR
jgi:hypothetical protein